MRISWMKYLALGITLIVVNACVILLLAYVVGNILDISPEFNEKVMEWWKTRQYPFPRWLILLIPRIVVWPISAEVVFQLSQTVLWGCNGFLLKRYASTMRPVLWVWVPIVLHAVAWDPLQVILGSASFYFTGRITEPGEQSSI